MKKLFCTIFAALLVGLCLPASAQEITTHLAVNLHDGGVEHFNLHELPVVKMEDHKIVVSTDNLESSYDFETVSHFSFELREVNKVETIATDNSAFTFTFLDNANIIISAPALEWAAVYNVAGVKVGYGVADGDHVVTINISDLPAGAYIVAPSCHSAIKIVKR